MCFVTPSSYDYYVEHGTVAGQNDVRAGDIWVCFEGSINLHGNYQSDFMGLDVEVKDEKGSRTSGRISDLTRRKVRLL